MHYGHYETIEEIGKGSMGIIYKAYDSNCDRLVALKVLLHNNETSIERFRNEARAIGRFSSPPHPNIVTVFEMKGDQDPNYIVMEFVDGKPLNKIIGTKKFGFEKVVNLGIQIAGALDYAHQRGVVHRDIKPGNIMVELDDHIKIIDFRISLIEDPHSTFETQVGLTMGTPGYMAPKQYDGSHVDRRADLFSLGVILYELATGSRPFRGRNQQDNLTEPTKKNHEISKELSDIIMKCLEKNPEDRFQTASAMVEALQNCLVKEEKKEEDTVIEKDTVIIDTVIIDDKKIIKQKQRKKSVLFSIFIITILCIIIKPDMDPYGTFNLLSEPTGAQIFIDDVPKGKTPLSIDLPGGRGKGYNVKLTLPPEYLDFKEYLTLEEGEVRAIKKKLRIAPSQKGRFP